MLPVVKLRPSEPAKPALLAKFVGYAELPEAGYTWFPAESKNLMANALPLKFDDATVWFAFVVAIPPEDRTTFATLPVKVNDLVPTTTPL